MAAHGKPVGKARWLVRTVLGGMIVCCLVVSTTFAGAPVESAKENGDLCKLQGAWTSTTGKIAVRLEFRDRKVTARVEPPFGEPIVARGDIRIDESVSPKALDWLKFTTDDEQSLPTVLGIYALEGDQLTIRTGGFAGRRPKEFKPGEGLLADVVVFRREAAVSHAAE